MPKPFDICGVRDYFSRLNAAFGWRYVLSVILTYGCNQAVGETIFLQARQYWLMDDIGLSSAAFGPVVAFARLPAQAKALFGLLSDTLPICGFHRTPYMLLFASVGVAANVAMAVWPTEQIGIALALVLLMGAYVGIAGIDTQIDATICERTSRVPLLGAELQSLAWGSLFAIQLPVTLLMGVGLQLVGAQPLFAVVALAFATTTIAPLRGWLHESAAVELPSYCDRCLSVFRHPRKRPVALAALLTASYSMSLGVTQTLLGAVYPNTISLLTIGGNLLFCLLLYLVLSRIDACLARAAAFVFLHSALSPGSSVLFEWAHEPIASSNDSRCYTAEQCAQLRADALAASSAVLDDDDGLPCGWALARRSPCIPPFTYTAVGVLGSVWSVAGTYLYSYAFQHWTYKSLLSCTQLLLVFVNLLDLVFVMRLNLLVGLPDVAFLVGDEIVGTIVGRLNMMPILTYAAKLCPLSVEASMFAIFMGLYNLGSDTGTYLGSGLLRFLGGVTAPDFDKLPEYVVWRSCARLLPLLLVPFLVPEGGPASTAESMGAGIGVTGDDERTTGDTGGGGSSSTADMPGRKDNASKREADARQVLLL